MFNKDKFKEEIYGQGYSVVRDVLSKQQLADLKVHLLKALDDEVKYHKTNEYADYGMVLLCSLYDKAFSDIFDNPKLTEPFNTILGEGCVVYAYTSSSMPPSTSNFSKRIHVDSPRIIPDYITNMGATILLDDFTEENGATWFLPSSQTRAQEPNPEFFYENAERLIEKAGSVWFFNARVWHAGGLNNTQDWRHALTINMCRSWMKQRIDIPRAMMSANKNICELSDAAKQKLGFFTQIPASYDEYYVAPELRKYKQKAE